MGIRRFQSFGQAWPIICYTCHVKGTYEEGTLWSCGRCGGGRFIIAHRHAGQEWQDKFGDAVRHLIGNRWKDRDYWHLLGKLSGKHSQGAH